MKITEVRFSSLLEVEGQPVEKIIYGPMQCDIHCDCCVCALFRDGVRYDMSHEAEYDVFSFFVTVNADVTIERDSRCRP